MQVIEGGLHLCLPARAPPNPAGLALLSGARTLVIRRAMLTASTGQRLCPRSVGTTNKGRDRYFMSFAGQKGAVVPIERLDVTAYTVPTEAPESDVTYERDRTTMVIVELTAGDEHGLGGDTSTRLGPPGTRPGVQAKGRQRLCSLMG